MHLPPLSSRHPWLMAMSGGVLALILALTLALFGWFQPVLSLLALMFLAGGVGLALFTLSQQHDRTRLIVLAALTLFAALIVLRAEPSVFTGRDQGSIALAAWELAQGHELAFKSPTGETFFAIYGPGRALNFPGFSYTDTGALITQFPLGYIAYLALFTQWFGLSGLLVANAVLFILSGWTFFELLSLFVSRRNALLGITLFATSFLPLWLAQLALTENLALLLFLTLTVSLVRLEQKLDASVLPLLILSGFLLALTRIEGFVIAPLAIGYILIRPKLRAHLLALPKRWTIPTLLFLGFLFLRDFFMNLPFYTMIAKAALKYWQEIGVSGSGGNEPNLGPIFISYGLFAVFVLGIASIGFDLLKRRFALLIPVLLALPTFIYLFDGHISDDHPWLLRRYAFTLFPLFLLATVMLWNTLEEKLAANRKALFAFGVFLILLTLQLRPAYEALSVVEYDTLYDQARAFGEQFTDRDLILIDRQSSGDPYALMAGPLAALDGKNAVYFFNPEDYARIDRNRFEHVYFLTTEDSLGRYAEAFGNELLPVEVVSFSHPTLAAPKPYAWPGQVLIVSDAILFEVTK